MSTQIPNIELYISMYIRKEALLSSQIEGTQATLDDIFNPYQDENVNLEVKDVINYIKALKYANIQLESFPISNRLIKEIHKILMYGLRGNDKYPGEFRVTQNWIGPSGSTLKTARFVPPNPETLVSLINNLEKFIHDKNEMEPLIKIALIHYQFETIHPFLDGNGRIGRLLINLLLKEYNLLTYDTLYISYFLKLNRVEYYDRLMEVRLKGDYEQWIKFFLEAIEKSSEDSIGTIKQLLKIHDLNYNKIEQITGRSKTTTLKIFNYLEENPIINIKRTSKALNMSFNAISNGIDILINLNILKQIDKGMRYRIFVYEDYLEILRKNTELN
jgi:Fic family protein